MPLNSVTPASLSEVCNLHFNISVFVSVSNYKMKKKSSSVELEKQAMNFV